MTGLKALRLVMCAAILAGTVSRAVAADAVYQYSVLEGDRRVYFWVPQTCRSVRGIIVAFKNLTEQRSLEDPIIRATAAGQCLGIVWIGEGHRSQLSADMGPGAGEAFLKMEQDLANESGFHEVANAPVIPTGHSAHGQFAWRFAQWAPERTIAAIPIKTVPLPADLRLRGVPMLYLVGQTTEWPQFKDGRLGDRDYFWPVVMRSMAAIRHQDTEQEIAVAVDPGGGHFDWSNADAKLVALFIRRACELRLPPVTNNLVVAPTLRKIPVARGWLMDSGGMNPDEHPPARVGHYAGVVGEASWVFDQAMTSAIGTLQGDRKRKVKQMLSFLQDGEVLPVAKDGFAALSFKPENDGSSFQLTPVFLKVIPAQLIHAGTLLAHSIEPIALSVITGPLVQSGPQNFSFAESREAGLDGWIAEEVADDGHFRRAVQPGKMHFTPNVAGAAQMIVAPPIPNQPHGTRSITLQATATSGLPVRFYVLSGPAKIEGNRLDFVEIPSGGVQELPIQIVAYQQGLPPTHSGGGVPAVEQILPPFFLARTR